MSKLKMFHLISNNLHIGSRKVDSKIAVTKGDSARCVIKAVWQGTHSAVRARGPSCAVTSDFCSLSFS